LRKVDAKQTEGFFQPFTNLTNIYNTPTLRATPLQEGNSNYLKIIILSVIQKVAFSSSTILRVIT
ncbi:MAG: hypothetical protein U9N34_06440, partial [Candidatus Cloacimonadota bacterium]|nr:hypothetical protein [Candidatus Cloacimonadota bacterium]